MSYNVEMERNTTIQQNDSKYRKKKEQLEKGYVYYKAETIHQKLRN